MSFNLADLRTDASFEELVAVSDAVSRLEEQQPRAGGVAQLRIFAGLSVAETAEALDLPLRTTERDRACARARLYERLQ